MEYNLLRVKLIPFHTGKGGGWHWLSGGRLRVGNEKLETVREEGNTGRMANRVERERC